MSPKKHGQSFGRKLRGLFRSEDWQHTPHNYAALSDGETSTAVDKVTSVLEQTSLFCSLTVKASSTEDSISSAREDPAKWGKSKSRNVPPSLEVENLVSYREINDLPFDSPTSMLATCRAGGLDSSGDRQRTEERYNAAISSLKETLEQRPANWGTVKLPEFEGLLEGQDISALQHAIEKRLGPRERSPNQSIWEKGKRLIEQVFVVLSPLAQNLLVIAKEGQAVRCLFCRFLMHLFRFQC